MQTSFVTKLKAEFMSSGRAIIFLHVVKLSGSRTVLSKTTSKTKQKKRGGGGTYIIIDANTKKI